MPASESRIPASSSTMRMLCMSGGSDRGSSFGDDGKLYDKSGANRAILLNPNRAVVILHDPAHNRKAQAGPSFFGGEVGKKELLLEFAGYAVSGIGNDNLHGIPASDQRGRDLDLA